jgi:hypothetical protein
MRYVSSEMRMSSDGDALLPIMKVRSTCSAHNFCDSLDNFKAYATSVMDTFLQNLSPKNYPSDKYLPKLTAKRAWVSRKVVHLLANSFTLVSCFTYSSTVKMETTYSSETSLDFQTTRRYIPKRQNSSQPPL